MGGAGRECSRRDPDRLILAFARLVTHYVRHDEWLPSDGVLGGVASIAEIPAVLINGRYDVQSPLGAVWALHRALPRSELVVVDDAGHDSGAPGIVQAIVAATDRFAEELVR